MKFCEVDTNIGEFEKVLDFGAVWIFDGSLGLQGSENHLGNKAKQCVRKRSVTPSVETDLPGGGWCTLLLQPPPSLHQRVLVLVNWLA